MNTNLYVVGHKNPDTDSICSAIAYAEMKNRLNDHAIACRLGPLNEETKFVLKKFDFENPLLLNDARSQLKDIDFDKPTLINENETVSNAWKLMINSTNRSLFVCNDDKKLTGILTTSNLSMMRTLTKDKINYLVSKANLESISKTIYGSIIYTPKSFRNSGSVYVITLNDTSLFNSDYKDSICILSDGAFKQLELINIGASLLLITDNQDIDEKVIEKAKEKDCAIIKTELDSMAVANLIRESFPIKYIMTKNIISFNEEEYVNDVAAKMLKSRVRSYPVLNENNDVVGAISRYHLQNYNKKRFVLVDHSERKQAILNIMDASIEEIIDHHHIGDIQTEKPIFYRNMRVGCTCTIVSLLYQENGLLPDKRVSGLLLSAIISDTLNFKSATTTTLDIQTATWLAKIAEIDDISEYAKEMLEASISIKNSSPDVILNRDLKKYIINDYKIAIGQTNYSELADVQLILPELKKIMEKEQANNNIDLLVMVFTHVLAEGSMLLYYGPLSFVISEIIEKSFDEHSGYDKNIISRKQQLIPKISNIINQL